jgi:hypothetical protein
MNHMLKSLKAVNSGFLPVKKRCKLWQSYRDTTSSYAMKWWIHHRVCNHMDASKSTTIWMLKSSWIGGIGLVSQDVSAIVGEAHFIQSQEFHWSSQWQHMTTGYHYLSTDCRTPCWVTLPEGIPLAVPFSGRSWLLKSSPTVADDSMIWIWFGG